MTIGTTPDDDGPGAPSATPLTYSSYLRLDELLSLQQPRSRPVEHDELLFIVIHQVYELWFKEMLHELDELVACLDHDRSDLGGHQLKRVLKILKTLVAQVDVLETMTPLEFVSFRSFLASSSGFQSAQFRELEFLLGMKSRAHLEHFADDPVASAALERRFREPSVWHAFCHHLTRQGYAIPDDVLARDPGEATTGSDGVQDALIAVYNDDAGLARLCESLTDLDEGLQEWRYRHVMMVQRTIGARHGTGGSSGVEYLRRTLFQPVFPDLWAIRSRF